MTTDFSNKIEILGQLYIQYRDETDFTEFIEFNDIGLPLAYLAAEGLCQVSDDGAKYIAETWDLFLSTLGLEDTGFDNLGEMFLKSKDI